MFFTAWSGRASEEVTFEERLTEKDGGEAEGKGGTQFREEPGLLLIRKKTNGSRHEPGCRRRQGSHQGQRLYFHFIFSDT